MTSCTMAENLPAKNDSQILIYQTEGGQTKIEVLLEDETVWLTQKLIAELFQTTIPNINMHIKNIFEEGGLDPDSVIKFFLTTAAGGKNYRTKFYSPDMIISVGYRVKSHVATRFRQWATHRLREYIGKGFVLDDCRLKNPDQPFDYFDELLRRIPVHTNNWTAKPDSFLQLNDRTILEHAKEEYHMKWLWILRKRNMKNSTGRVYDTATQNREILMRLSNR